MLIVFSGIDGAGKTTQIERLLAQLRDEGRAPVYLWSRGGYTPLFNALKSLLRRLSGKRLVPESGRSPQRKRSLSRPVVRKVWLTLALLDLILLYGLVLRWWRWRGRPIVCDRYLWDTLVDFRLNFPQEQVETWLLWRLLRRAAPRPDAAFLLLVPVEESVRRSHLKDEPFPDSPDVLAKRLGQYQTLAEKGHWQVLDGRRAIDDLAHQIQMTLSDLPSADAAAPA